MINVDEKNNWFGIGYHPSSGLLNPEGQNKSRYIKEVFNSDGFQHGGLVAVIGYASL